MSVSAPAILHALERNNLSIFRSADVATLTGLSAAATTHALARLTRQGLLLKLKRGLWLRGAPENIPAQALVPHLTAPWPSYVSLYSALSQHSVVAEVPHIIYGVTAGRPARYKNALGNFHIHHLPGHLMWGYDMAGPPGGDYPLADPEKSFLDLVYLALTPRSRLEMPQKRGNRWKLDLQKLARYAGRFNYPPLIRFLRLNRLIPPL